MGSNILTAESKIERGTKWGKESAYSRRPRPPFIYFLDKLVLREWKYWSNEDMYRKYKCAVRSDRRREERRKIGNL